MLSFTGRTAAAIVVATALIAMSGGHAARTLAGSGRVTITTDQPQYSVGDVAKVCYTVLGPGRVTILDMRPDGTSQAIVSAVDDGTGGCFQALVTPPTGNECLQINDTSGGNDGSSQTCFQVQQGSGGSSQPAAQDCGQVNVLGGQVTSSGSAAIENCFYQAYQSCTPATLEVSISGVDAGINHTFSLIFSGSFCAIQDSQQHFVVPRPPGPATTTVCAGLTQTSDGGLLFSNCGGSDVQVPAGS
jgi:hypothetical protein